jgi:anti-sigma factor RsiW
MTHEPMPPEAELAKLADGSLPADREAELRAQVRHSPNLTAALAEQERVVSLVRALDEPAPDALRARVEALTGGSSPTRPTRAARGRRHRMRRTLVLPGATALAVAIAAVVILIGGSGSPPTVPQAAHLALSAATLPPPGVEPGKPGLLRMSAAGIPFSNWRGWRPVGARTDVVSGRQITTVFYEKPNARVGYAIVSGPPLEGDGREGGGYNVTYTLGHQGSVQFVTWVRDGHTCVIAGHRADPSTLLRLARESGASSSS